MSNVLQRVSGNSFNAFSLTMTNIIFPDYIFCDAECFGNLQLQQIIDKKMESEK